MGRLEQGPSAGVSPQVVTTGDLFRQIDGAIDGVARWLANDLGMPSLALRDARANLAQLRELVDALERAA